MAKTASLIEVFKRVDIFGKSVSFNISGQAASRSFIGATITVLVTFLTIAYAWMRLKVLIDFGDTRFQETEDYRDDMTEEFAQSATLFNLAIGLDSIRGSSERVDMTGYLEMRAEMKLGRLYAEEEELGMHVCTQNDRDQHFYEHATESRRTLIEEQFLHLNCFDQPEKLNLKGVRGMDAISHLMLEFKKCRGHSYCKSDQEINDFIDKHRVVLIFN